MRMRALSERKSLSADPVSSSDVSRGHRQVMEGDMLVPEDRSQLTLVVVLAISLGSDSPTYSNCDQQRVDSRWRIRWKI